MSFYKWNIAVFFLANLLFFSISKWQISQPQNQSPSLLWTAIDVNQTLQGDAHLITLPHGERILIDTGVLDSGLVSYIQKTGIKRIDTVFITHAHRDHYGSLLPLLNSGITMGQVYFNAPPYEACLREKGWGCEWQEVQQMRSSLESLGILAPQLEGSGLLYRDEHSTVELVASFSKAPPGVEPIDVNDSSLVLRISFEGRSLLFTGDLNLAIGDHLLKKGISLSSDILKVPHHGAENMASDIFFDKVQPDIFYIPAPLWLWKHPRTARMRNYLKSVQKTFYVSGLHRTLHFLISSPSHLSVLTDAQFQCMSRFGILNLPSRSKD